MKDVYIVISQTGTFLSTILKIITGKEYNHASISLDSDLNKMYSFGRKNPYNPFIGVFLIEKINVGTYKRFINTKCKVIKISVTVEQYDLILCKLNEMVVDMDKYKYNLLGLFFAAIHINWHSDNKFYCSEFVRYILAIGSVDVSMLPEIVHPINFLDMDGGCVLYEGLLKDYPESRRLRL